MSGFIVQRLSNVTVCLMGENQDIKKC